MKKPRLIPVKDKAALSAAGIPFTTSTLYTFRNRGKFPSCFVKVAGILMLNLDAYERDIIAPALAETEANVERIESNRRTA